ncbi:MULTISPECIES: ABC transporter substrate-binding protein [unclassified Mesorhizobium]|uniref:ABC transporter substrate-binding protein n=1 Tax=unclassified Mesorhizobium TaxID=325217 RepID=UPI0009618D74|nr:MULTISPECIES: ABC transporter substrate-binding protein [unclassified Mesorhizobium]MBN9258089.1 carbohydrate ABC transporter substrate-binding protein [Mesorhizobium sp.]OJX71607.1 MAG: ABC transporter substrate-binding protein [Mesorhizobium sp. 65-26]
MKPTRLFTAAGFAALLLSGTAHADPVKLTLWHMEQPPHRVQRMQELLDEFNKAHPDIQVRQEPQSWGEVYAKAPAAFAAGNGPDLLFTIPDFTTVLRKIDAVVPVDDLAKDLDAKHGFVPATIAPYKYDDHVWAVPAYNMAISLWYRNSALKKAGIEVPKTWSEWQAAAEKLGGDGRYGIGLPANKQLYTDQTVYGFMVNSGAADIYKDDGSIDFDKPGTVKAYDFYSKLAKLSPADNASWTWGEAEACFASNTCGMILQFSVINTYDTQAEGDAADLGVAAVPHEDGEKESATISYSNAIMLTTKDKAKQDAAKVFLAWLLEPANYGRFLTMEPGLFLPVTNDGAKADSFWNDKVVTKYKPQIETMIANSQNGKLFGFTTGKVFPSIGAISAQNVIAETLQHIVVDGQSAADAVKAGEAKMSEIAKK